MLRLPRELALGPYTVHLDVLAARLQRRRRRIRQRALVLGVLTALSASVWLAVPLLRGSGVLVVPPLPAAAQVRLDDHVLAAGSHTLPSGDHTLRIERPGAFPVSNVVQISRGQTTTLALPALRQVPVVQPLPLPNPQSAWLQASPDAGSGWRMMATRPAAEATGTRPGWGQAQAPPARYQLHLDAQGLTRLSVLETYPVADEIVAPDGARFWAVWEPQADVTTTGAAGSLTLTTPAVSRVISTTTSPRGIWWSPGGRALLAALPHDLGVDLIIIDPARPQLDGADAVITAPGVVQSVSWSSDGRAAVVVTAPAPDIQPGGARVARPTPVASPSGAKAAVLERSAVLIQLPQAGGRARATRLRVPPSRPAGLIPLAWSEDALWWVTDTGLGLALDRVSLASGAAERIDALPDDLVALTALPGGSLRIARLQADGRIAVQRWPGGQTLFVLPDITAHDGAGGIWHGGELLVATAPESLWYVQIQAEALQ